MCRFRGHCALNLSDIGLWQVFGRTAWEGGARKYFRFLHFTTEDARANSPRVLRFSFNLPPIDKVRNLLLLLFLVFRQRDSRTSGAVMGTALGHAAPCAQDGPACCGFLYFSNHNLIVYYISILFRCARWGS